MADIANTNTSILPNLKETYPSKRERFKRIQELMSRTPSSIQDINNPTDEEIIQRHLEEEKRKEDAYREFQLRQMEQDRQF